MNNIIKQIEVDVYSPTFYEVIKAQQGDKNSRFVEFILFNQGDPYTVPDNTIVKLEGSRANKSPIIKPCIIKDNSITIELDSDLLYYHGISHLKLVLYEENEKSILSTIPFTLSVQKNPLDSDKFEKDNYSLLNQLILQTETVNQNLEKHISDNDDPHTIIYEEPDTLSKLTVGEKLSDTFGKLSKAISDLISHINDNIRHITSTERENWDDAYNKRHIHSNKDLLDNITASYTAEEKNKLDRIQDGAQINVQSDWNISDSDSDAYIKNKPSVYTRNEIDNKFSALETNIDWKESVDTFDDIASIHQNPQDGWTVNVKDTDYTYRYNGTEWIPISANAIPKATNSVDGLLSKEDHASYEDANSKKHSHSNKSVLDKVTQTLLDNWNAAYSHISDNIKHITSTERSLWNTVSNKVDKVSGKGLSTNDYTTEEKNILASLSAGSVTGVKGNTETAYRQGNINITPDNIGALPLTGGTITGDLYFTKTSANDKRKIKINGGDVLYIMPNSGYAAGLRFVDIAENPVATIGYWKDNYFFAGESYNNPNGKFKASEFIGKLTGNAATATKATQDSNGNIITSTYLPLSGGTVTGNTTFSNPLTIHKGIELFHTTPYIDFHFNNSTNDYTSRISETSSGVLEATGTFKANTFYTGNWFRSTGTSGWFNDTYGGGIYMADNTYVRVYNNKHFYCDSSIVTRGALLSHTSLNSYSGQLIISMNNSNNSTIFRDDGSYFYILFGSETAFNSLRPLYINKATGDIHTSHNLYGNVLRSSYAANADTTAKTNCYISTEGIIVKTSTTSSKRFKDDITINLSDELNPDRLYNIDIVQFKYKKEHFTNKEDIRYRKNLIGFIAEDIYKKYPIAADYHYNENGEILVDGWNDTYMIPAMLKLIQDQKKEIDLLKKSVSNLNI